VLHIFLQHFILLYFKYSDGFKQWP